MGNCGHARGTWCDFLYSSTGVRYVFVSTPVSVMLARRQRWSAMHQVFKPLLECGVGLSTVQRRAKHPVSKCLPPLPNTPQKQPHEGYIDRAWTGCLRHLFYQRSDVGSSLLLFALREPLERSPPVYEATRDALDANSGGLGVMTRVSVWFGTCVVGLEFVFGRGRCKV